MRVCVCVHVCLKQTDGQTEIARRYGGMQGEREDGREQVSE